MTKPTITPLPDPSGFSPDPLTDILRSGARRLIEQAVEAELTALLAAYADDKTEDGRSRVVRHGYLPEREVMTGIGPVPVKVPRVRDRAAGGEKVRFTSSILPPYLRKAKSVEELLPWLYLKGISSGDFQEALAALLGPNAAGMSSTTISRLKAAWWDEFDRWQRRDLGARRIVYIWADGVYFQPRMAEEKQCVLVVIGADEWGRKEVLGLTDGYRESTQSWRELLIDLKRRGLTRAPELAIGDGALGFWAALREVFGSTREQRCWVHKTGNVLNTMPKSVQPKAKGHLHDIWQAETKAEAEAAFDFFIETYGVKYDKARDPEMSSTKKGNDWYLGMKAHVGVDAVSGTVHNLEATTAKVHDSRVWDELLHGDETSVWADKGYFSAERVAAFTGAGKVWGVMCKAPKGSDLHPIDARINRIIAMVRASVEHPFRVVKRQFGYMKTRYRGLAKNRAQLFTLFALGNLFLLRRRLMA